MVKNYWKDILIVLLIFAIGYLYFYAPKEEVEVPVRIEVPVPVISNEFKARVNPAPLVVKEKEVIIDSSYYNKWLKLKDSIERDRMIRDALTIREYNTKFEDDTLTIDIYSKVRGTLLEVKSKYTTKPFTTVIDTTLKVKVPARAKFYGGFELIMPTRDFIGLGNEPLFQVGGILKTKEDRLIKVGITNKKQVVAGYYWKF